MEDKEIICTIELLMERWRYGYTEDAETLELINAMMLKCDNTVYKVVKAEDTKESILTELIRLESILGDEQNDFVQIGKQRAYRDIRCFIQK